MAKKKAKKKVKKKLATATTHMKPSTKAKKKKQFFDVKSILDHWEDQYTRYLPKSDDLSLVTLKGHLLVETILDELIKAYCRDPQPIAQANLRFYQKAKITRAFIGSLYPGEMWDSIMALNSLRNELVHTLEPRKMRKRVRQFLSFRHSQNSESASRRVSLRTESVMAKEVYHSIAYLLGALSVIDVVNKFMESQKRYS